MRAEEIRELSDDEIRARILELEEERFRLRFRSATETLEDPLRLRVVRREVARLKTVLLERKRGAAQSAAPNKDSAKSSKGTRRTTRATGGTRS